MFIVLQWERKTNLSRFEGSSSISSADYFGTGSSHTSGGGSHLTSTDLEDVKESVRQGVTKVAGKLSSIANGVMSSIQVSTESCTLPVIEHLL
jgi:ADP-ribosylation factor GTPase-activating protein 2/3